MSFKEHQLLRKAARLTYIIGIYSRDDGRARGSQQFVKTGRKAAIFSRDYTNATVPRSIRCRDLERSVSRAVIQHQKLEISKVLPKHTFDGLGDKQF